MEVGDLHKVWEIRAPKTKPDEPSARALLDRIAKQVQPIMRRRKRRVKVLSEFSPKNPRLLGLNVNGGVEVKLRLRRAGRDYDFIPYEEVLDTMLHELTHIARGPHDAQFYKLWDELRKECEELVSKGITGPGQGFDGTGRRLGGFSIHPPPPSLRQATLTAAQKRARNGALLPSGPRKLGGNNDIMSALSPIQAAAMAAERRMHDDLWCGSHDQSGIDDSEDVVILEKPPNWPTRDRKDTKKGKNTKGVSSSGSAESSTSSGFQVAARGDSSSCRTTDASISSLWECSSCTLLNQVTWRPILWWSTWRDFPPPLSSLLTPLTWHKSQLASFYRSVATAGGSSPRIYRVTTAWLEVRTQLWASWCFRATTDSTEWILARFILLVFPTFIELYFVLLLLPLFCFKL